MLSNKRGQSALEYGLLISVVVVALLAVNIYMRKAVQGRLKESSDQVGRQFDTNSFETAWRSASSGNTSTTESRGGGTGETTTTITVSENAVRSEHDTFGNTPGLYTGY